MIDNGEWKYFHYKLEVKWRERSSSVELKETTRAEIEMILTRNNMTINALFRNDINKRCHIGVPEDFKMDRDCFAFVNFAIARNSDELETFINIFISKMVEMMDKAHKRKNPTSEINLN